MYASDFLTDLFKGGFVLASSDPKSMGFEEKVDRASLTVEVTLEFK
jgi:hypothetical protein